jgi:hypothetical protein
LFTTEAQRTQRGTSFFVYRDLPADWQAGIPIDENNLSSIDPLITACFDFQRRPFSFACLSRQMKRLFSVRSVSLW